MLTIVNTDTVKEMRGLLADRPASAPNGSFFVGIDTGKIYIFDEENSVWYTWGEQSNQ